MSKHHKKNITHWLKWEEAARSSLEAAQACQTCAQACTGPLQATQIQLGVCSNASVRASRPKTTGLTCCMPDSVRLLSGTTSHDCRRVQDTGQFGPLRCDRETPNHSGNLCKRPPCFNLPHLKDIHLAGTHEVDGISQNLDLW